MHKYGAIVESLAYTPVGLLEGDRPQRRRKAEEWCKDDKTQTLRKKSCRLTQNGEGTLTSQEHWEMPPVSAHDAAKL